MKDTMNFKEDDNMKEDKVLLLACLRKESEEEKIACLKQYNVVDWKETLVEAELHGVVSLLFYCIKNISSYIDIDRDDLEEMRRKYYVCAAKNMRLYRELQKLLDIFECKNIPVILLKGAHLSESVYGNLALRGMGDVDLLVRQNDLKLIEECIFKSKGKAEEHNRVITQYNCHFRYETDGKLSLEIHWKLFPSVYAYRIDIDGIWDRAKLKFKQTGVLVMSFEDLLIYTCAHAAKHAEEMRLRILCDITEILSCYENRMDWAVIGARASKWGILRAVYTFLRLSRELLGASVTEEQLAALRPDQFEEKKYLLAMKKILGYGSADNKPKTSEPAARLWGLKGVKGKFKLILESIFLPRELMSLMYPASADSHCIYLYYPIRLKDLLVRHSKSMWRLMIGDKKTRISAEKVNEVSMLREWLLSG
jgi:hypothetical protein